MTETIERIILFLMASSVIIQMVTEDSYKKCMKFFVGLVFLVFVFSTVFKGVNIFKEFDLAFNDITGSFGSEEEYESIFNEYYGNLEDENGG